MTIVPNVKYSYSDTFKNNVKKLTRMDLIRISKLLEQIQFSAIAFGFGLITGIPLNTICNVTNDEKKSNSILFFEIILHFCFVIVISYYLKKILIFIPFLFSLTPSYISNLKNEAHDGIALGLGMVFMSTQTNLHSKITLLKDRFNEYYIESR